MNVSLLSERLRDLIEEQVMLELNKIEKRICKDDIPWFLRNLQQGNQGKKIARKTNAYIASVKSRDSDKDGTTDCVAFVSSAAKTQKKPTPKTPKTQKKPTPKTPKTQKKPTPKTPKTQKATTFSHTKAEAIAKIKSQYPSVSNNGYGVYVFEFLDDKIECSGPRQKAFDIWNLVMTSEWSKGANRHDYRFEPCKKTPGSTKFLFKFYFKPDPSVAAEFDKMIKSP